MYLNLNQLMTNPIFATSIELDQYTTLYRNFRITSNSETLCKSDYEIISIKGRYKAGSKRVQRKIEIIA